MTIPGSPPIPLDWGRLRTAAIAQQEQTRRHRMTMKITESAGQRPFGRLAVDGCFRPFLILLFPQRCPDSACARSSPVGWCTTRDPSYWSSGDGLEFEHLLGFGGGLGGGAAAGQDVESEVAATFGPFVVLLGQDGAHQADDRGAVGEDPDTSVRRRISRFNRSLGLLDQIWRHTS
jgi:hypothetical protein